MTQGIGRAFVAWFSGLGCLSYVSCEGYWTIVWIRVEFYGWGVEFGAYLIDKVSYTAAASALY